MVFKKIIFQNRYVALETPSRPPPLHGKYHLKFPFWLSTHLPYILSNVKIGVRDIPSPFAKESSWMYRRVPPPASPVCCLWNRLSHLVAPGWTKTAETCPTTLRTTVQKTRSLWNPSLHQLFIFTAGQLVAPPGTNAVKIEEMTVKPGGQLNKQDSRVCLTASLFRRCKVSFNWICYFLHF